MNKNKKLYKNSKVFIKAYLVLKLPNLKDVFCFKFYVNNDLWILNFKLIT